MPFFVQCDTQIAKQEELVNLLGRAGCFEMFVGVESFHRPTLLAAHKTQNHPSAYGEIVRLCRKYKIAVQFSNMIGFPNDTRASIDEHLDVLSGIGPDGASFYILTPIPGTQQYDEFLEAGLITEQNLDRYDATTPTWRHPNLESAELQQLLLRCYRKFYSARHIFTTALQGLSPKGFREGFIAHFGHPLFNRVAAEMKTHPMSGGVGRVRLDSVADYRELRQKQFGFELVPLPKSLELSKADAELNRKVKIVI
jgi:radical SAM superfamily enzyme YgiQ (UPF0313 family)